MMMRQAVKDNPAAEGIVLGSHGLFTWGDTQRACYENSIRTIDQLGEFVQGHAREVRKAGVRRSGRQRDDGSRVYSRCDSALPSRRRLFKSPRDRALREFP